ncbi:MAG TPA: hypothetical protein VN736_07155 [Candidatus Limnocylindrales bacterium]|nr:hypothetical protein [Candidatus Limnocylindrales bacterium]
MRTRAALLLLLAATLPAADLDILPPNAKMVVGIRVKSLTRAIESAGLTDQLRKQSEGLAIPGFDPFQDIDEIVIATESEGQNPPALMLLTGRFPLLLATAATTQRYRQYPIYKPATQPDQIFAILDPNTALAGDRKLVEQAIDRRDGEPKPSDAVAARIAALRDRYDIWGTGDHSGRFTFGASLQHGLECIAEYHATDPKEAQQMRDAVTLLQSMAKSALSQQGKSAAKFDVSMQNGTMKLAITVPEAEWEKALQAQKASLTQAVAARLAAPKPPATPQKIVSDDKGNTLSVTLPGK